MNKVILVRYGEIVLKGLNRPVFEDKLISNIKKALNGIGDIKIIKSQSRIYIQPLDEHFDHDAACEKLVKVFGIVSVSIVYKVNSDMQAIKNAASQIVEAMIKAKKLKTFKVETKRGDKKFPLQSPEISAEIGGHILSKYNNLKVDVHNPDFILFAEVRENAYLYSDIIPANGGLPVGTNGRAMLLLSGGIDSPAAGWMMAKRGVKIEAVHFHSYPYTSERAKEKVIELANILAEYCGRIKLHVVPFTEIQLEINEKCPHDCITIIMRRFMMRIAEQLAKNNNCTALITGENMGQVASQTMQSLYVTNASVSMPVFRPLIGMDKTEIIEIARKIGTFETSILPYEDCCTVFVAKHPKTKPVLQKIIEYEKKLDEDAMIKKAVETTELIIAGK